MAQPNRKILIVDDNESAAQGIAELLQLMGYETCVSYTGKAGLVAVKTFDPDTVILDIGLPDMDGYKVARKLRASGASSLRLIAHSGFGQETDIQNCYQAGFDFHLTKPANLEQIKAAIK